jgi:hypothetical protein
MRRLAPDPGAVARTEANTGEIVERSHPDCQKPLRCPFRFQPCHRTLKPGSALQRGRPVSIVPPFTCPDNAGPTPTWRWPSCRNGALVTGAAALQCGRALSIVPPFHLRG